MRGNKVAWLFLSLLLLLGKYNDIRCIEILLLY